MSCNKMNLVSDAVFNSSEIRNFVCEIFPKAKQPRLPFPTRQTMSNDVFSCCMWIPGGLIIPKLMLAIGIF